MAIEFIRIGNTLINLQHIVRITYIPAAQSETSVARDFLGIDLLPTNLDVKLENYQSSSGDTSTEEKVAREKSTTPMHYHRLHGPLATTIYEFLKSYCVKEFDLDGFVGVNQPQRHRKSINLVDLLKAQLSKENLDASTGNGSSGINIVNQPTSMVDSPDSNTGTDGVPVSGGVSDSDS